MSNDKTNVSKTDWFFLVSYSMAKLVVNDGGGGRDASHAQLGLVS